jgi:hypothetical protein
MLRRFALIASCVAISATALVAVALPSSGQIRPPLDPTVTGVATCSAEYTSVITWTLTFDDPLYVGATIDVSTPGVLSGAATGNVTFTPAQFTAPGSASGQTVLPGTTAGTVNLQQGWGIVEGDGGAVQAAVTLDGTCAAPTPVVAPARFTG